MYVTGIVAFVLLFINDFNDWKIDNKLLKLCFPIGSLLLIISSVWMCVFGSSEITVGLPARIGVWIAIVIFFAAEIYSLFFSFDRDEAYAGNTSGNERMATTTRMYALCRHPGVLFFIFLYAGLIVVTHMTVSGAAMLCGLNVLLIVFEDILVFPAILSGYDEYKGTTPFLIPNSTSVIKCVKDFRK